MAGRDKRQLVEVSCLSAPLPEFWDEAAERARGGTLLVTNLDRLDEYGQRDMHCLLAKLATQARPPQLVATALPELDHQQHSGGLRVRSMTDWRCCGLMCLRCESAATCRRWRSCSLPPNKPPRMADQTRR